MKHIVFYLLACCFKTFFSSDLGLATCPLCGGNLDLAMRTTSTSQGVWEFQAPSASYRLSLKDSRLYYDPSSIGQQEFLGRCRDCKALWSSNIADALRSSLALIKVEFGQDFKLGQPSPQLPFLRKR